MLPSPSSLESAYRSTPSTFACTDVKSPLWEEAMSLVARMTSIYFMLALWKIMQQCKQYAQNTRRYSAAFGVTETAETDFRVLYSRLSTWVNAINEGLNPPRSFNLVSPARNRSSGDPNCELFPQDPIIPVPPGIPLCRSVGTCGNK